MLDGSLNAFGRAEPSRDGMFPTDLRADRSLYIWTHHHLLVFGGWIATSRAAPFTTPWNLVRLRTSAGRIHLPLTCRWHCFACT